jgi:predicted RNA binding protein YcfA (HicA-like mRNA interferase family)
MFLKKDIDLYTMTMKLRDLKRRLRRCGWFFLREGSSHEVWTNGDHVVALPRHREVVESTAAAILRKALLNPGVGRKAQ